MTLNRHLFHKLLFKIKCSQTKLVHQNDFFFANSSFSLQAAGQFFTINYDDDDDDNIYLDTSRSAVAGCSEALPK